MYIYPDNLKSKATLWLWEAAGHRNYRHRLPDFGLRALPAGMAAAHCPDGGLCLFIHPFRGCEHP